MLVTSSAQHSIGRGILVAVVLVFIAACHTYLLTTDRSASSSITASRQ